MSIKNDYGSRIEYVIKRILQVNQSEFAEMLGLSRAQISSYVNEKSHPSRDVLQKLQDLGINPQFIEYPNVSNMFADNENGELLRNNFFQDRFNLPKNDDLEVNELKFKIDKLENFIREKFVDYNGIS